MRRLLMALVWAVCGYLVGAFGGGFLINALSSNQFDRSVEAAMTGAFVTGPVGGVLAFIAGFVWSGRSRPPTA